MALEFSWVFPNRKVVGVIMRGISKLKSASHLWKGWLNFALLEKTIIYKNFVLCKKNHKSALTFSDKILSSNIKTHYKSEGLYCGSNQSHCWHYIGWVHQTVYLLQFKKRSNGQTPWVTWTRNIKWKLMKSLKKRRIYSPSRSIPFLS